MYIERLTRNLYTECPTLSLSMDVHNQMEAKTISVFAPDHTNGTATDTFN